MIMMMMDLDACQIYVYLFWPNSLGVDLYLEVLLAYQYHL